MSTSNHALVFYGFPVGDSDCEGFNPQELEDRIDGSGLAGVVQDVPYGSFDDYAHALAIPQSYIEVDAGAETPLERVPDQDYMISEKWNKQLQEAAKALGVKFKTPHWYFAAWVL